MQDDIALETAPSTSLPVKEGPETPMSPLSVYLLFLKFGLRAFGGPVVQIADQKEELVTKGKWITEEKFKRVFSVYQLLPGPEATELACYFGRLAGGRLGAVMGGLGFITPGLLLMLLFSWFYLRYGLTNGVFVSVFSGLQPAICAMVFRACHKISDFSFRDHAKGEWDWGLAGVGGMAAFLSVLNVNYFIAKAHLLVAYFCYVKWCDAVTASAEERERLHSSKENVTQPSGQIALPQRLWFVATIFWVVAPTLVYIGSIGAYGKLDVLVPMGVGVALKLGNTYGAQFVVGLLGGLVTFGGAYTAIPFIEYEAVRSGGWVVAGAFFDSLAVAQVLPTPLVMFVTMIGYLSGAAMPNGSELTALWGSLLMTLGMFIPAFVFPVCFHDTLERAMSGKGVAVKVLDSIAATVVGQIFITALQLLRSSVKTPLHAIIFYAALQTAYFLPHKYTPVFIVFASGLAGVVLFY